MQATAPDASTLRHLSNPELSSVQLLRDVCKAYAHRVAFRVSPPHQSKYAPISYAEVWARAADIATGKHQHSLSCIEQPPSLLDGIKCSVLAGLAQLGLASRGEFVSICGFSSLSWVLSDFAVCYLGGYCVLSTHHKTLPLSQNLPSGIPLLWELLACPCCCQAASCSMAVGAERQ